MDRKLRVLISNDDGYDADGIQALARAMRAIAEVYIVAPKLNHSGTSSSISLADLQLETISADTLAVHGTPVDCVQIALHTPGVLPWQPDLTVTGINHGENMSDSTIHSGTVGAAGESAQAGIPAIGFSLANTAAVFPPIHFEAAAQVAAELVERLHEQLLATPTMMLNVNFPDLPYAQIKAPQLCQLGRRDASRNPTIVDSADANGVRLVRFADYRSTETDLDLDHVAVKAGHVAITPLQFNLTATDKMDEISTWFS